VPDHYRIRLLGMARFAQKYTRPDGTTPLLGDADDARVLPFGGQAIGDHRYLAALVGAHWHADGLTDGFSGSRSEIVWALGRRAAALMDHVPAPRTLQSAAFPEGGCYVMRNDRDHVFIDCGPVGQRGRGGHGHNDCLSFEAMLDGVHLVTDCGAYVYTASARERNIFRSTASHNTPQIDAEELNRFIRWDYLWTLHDDAKPEVRAWEAGTAADVFTGSHSGYQRLPSAVRPVRTITLDHARHVLTSHDTIEGAGEHLVAIPLHLAPGVTPRIGAAGRVLLEADGRAFEIAWAGPDGWSVAIEPARVSPSYGVVVPAARLVWSRRGALPATLTLTLSAVHVANSDPQPVLAGATA
jgi:uncharacterized heparinase superfamily protein